MEKSLPELRALMQDIENAPAYMIMDIKYILSAALKDNHRAVEAINAYRFGKPKETVETTTKKKVEMSLEEKEAMIKQLKRVLRKDLADGKKDKDI
jgi:hypothetical protein